MIQLEESSQRPPRSTANGLHSPVLDPTEQPNQPPEPEPEVKDWISKARESIDAFGGFINMGGAGIPKNLLIPEELEDSASENDVDDYEIAVEDEDGSDIGEDGLNETNSLKTPPTSARKGSMSSTGAKKKTSKDKPANLPSEAVPFGLMATLALRARKTDNNQTHSDGENNVGVANEEFFRASGSHFFCAIDAKYSHWLQVPLRIHNAV
jgi:hypothetical protein